MTTIPRIPRNYPMNDAAMLNFCYLINIQLADNLPDFEAFNAKYTPMFVADFGNAISNAMNLENDYQLKYSHMQSGLDVKGKLIECRNAFQMIKHFVISAFANSAGIWQDFGFGAYTKARDNADVMIQFMTDLHQTALKYETELSAAGYGATPLAQLLSLKNELQTLITLKNQTKGNRYVGTQQRIEAYNAVWHTCREICNAAKIIYNANYGKYQMFLKRWRKKETNANGFNDLMPEETP